mmetsp:Transcript_47478/g.113951  ORF Transcript_47478/g.113951 Transcript_47478/m.113951 type:complete len:334 (+) Transcript_47478:652-1653(+)
MPPDVAAVKNVTIPNRLSVPTRCKLPLLPCDVGQPIQNPGLLTPHLLDARDLRPHLGNALRNAVDPPLTPQVQVVHIPRHEARHRAGHWLVCWRCGHWCWGRWQGRLCVRGAWLATASLAPLVQQSLESAKAGGFREVRVPIGMQLDTEAPGPTCGDVACRASDQCLACCGVACRWLTGLARHGTTMVALVVQSLLDLFEGRGFGETRVPGGMELYAKILGPLHVCVAPLAHYSCMTSSRHIGMARSRWRRRRRWRRARSAASCKIGSSIMVGAVAAPVQQHLEVLEAGAPVQGRVPAGVQPEADVPGPGHGREAGLARHGGVALGQHHVSLL